MPIGTPELLVIGSVVVLLFGTQKLPKLGSALGESIRNFKKGIAEGEREQSLPEAKSSKE